MFRKLADWWHGFWQFRYRCRICDRIDTGLWYCRDCFDEAVQKQVNAPFDEDSPVAEALKSGYLAAMSRRDKCCERDITDINAGVNQGMMLAYRLAWKGITGLDDLHEVVLDAKKGGDT